jgi:hypothetical protein
MKFRHALRSRTQPPIFTRWIEERSLTEPIFPLIQKQELLFGDLNKI